MPSRIAGSGLVRALTFPHGPERFLELVAPRFALDEVRAEVMLVERPSPGSVTLHLRTNRNWPGFRAGQFVNVTVEIDGRRHTRCYSPACSEHCDGRELELTVRAHPHGLVSSHLNARARAGMVLGLSRPAGEFVLPDPRPDHLLLISGGSGITPVLAILRTLADEEHPGRITFIHYTQHRREHPYRELLERLSRDHPRVGVHVIGTREGVAPGGAHLTRRQLSTLDADYLRAEAYVCGPPALIAAARAIWEQAGAEQRLHRESFLPVTAPVSDEGGRICFTRSGIEVASSGLSLLEQAERAGLSPTYGCRMGICHTCTTRKLAGRVRDLRGGELSGEEPQDVQLCVSVPAGDVELEL
ncbi:MAG TPA: ferredoxin reductase [Solirubrobacteraceae bacterium]|nr:ferredoxin reductase [Solirubrobacteraceae bacterium]